jgi:hypothetical protein
VQQMVEMADVGGIGASAVNKYQTMLNEVMGMSVSELC